MDYDVNSLFSFELRALKLLLRVGFAIVRNDLSKSHEDSRHMRGPTRDTSPLPHRRWFYSSGGWMGKDAGHAGV